MTLKVESLKKKDKLPSTSSPDVANPKIIARKLILVNSVGLSIGI